MHASAVSDGWVVSSANHVWTRSCVGGQQTVNWTRPSSTETAGLSPPAGLVLQEARAGLSSQACKSWKLLIPFGTPRAIPTRWMLLSAP